MAAHRLVDVAPKLAVALTAVAGVWASGRGFMNGDAACYAAQAAAGDLSERVVHVGYLVVAAALAPLAGEGLPWWLDLWSAAAAAALVAVWGARGVAPALIAAAMVLPWAGFAEVDLVWMAAVSLAVRARSDVGSAVWAGVGVTVSPAAALTAPWMARERGVAPVIGVVVAVAALSVGTEGAWWWGDRGVGSAPTPALGRALGAWCAAGVPLLALWARDPRVLWLMPLWVLPTDVPGWVLGGLVAGSRWRSSAWGASLAAVALGLGLLGLGRRAERVATEDAALRAVVSALRPGDVLEGPWTWGARASVIATGQPYALRWVATPPVRDQALCPARRVGLLPPGRRDHAVTEVDARGVAWRPADCAP